MITITKTKQFMLCLIANVLFCLGYAGSTFAATKDLGNTGWYAEFDGAKVKDAKFEGTTFTVIKEFADLTPIDIKFIEKNPAAADDFGLRITLNETVKNTSQNINWKSFGLELIDPNPVLIAGDPNGNILGKNDNVATNHPGFAHFHKDPGQTFTPFTPDPNPNDNPATGGIARPQQGKVITLTGGNGINAGDMKDWKGIGIHQIEEKAQQRNFILRETPFKDAVPPPFAVSPIPEPETYAMLLAGLGLMGVVVRRRSSLKISISRGSAA
jgi:hypothetical protein